MDEYVDDATGLLLNLAHLLRLLKVGANIAAINAGLTVAFLIVVLWLRF